MNRMISIRLFRNFIADSVRAMRKWFIYNKRMSESKCKMNVICTKNVRKMMKVTTRKGNTKWKNVDHFSNMKPHLAVLFDFASTANM